jgi:hypothetical protein
VFNNGEFLLEIFFIVVESSRIIDYRLLYCKKRFVSIAGREKIGFWLTDGPVRTSRRDPELSISDRRRSLR